MSPLKAVLAAAALVLAASVAYAAWSAHEKKAEQASIAALVEQGASAITASLEQDPTPELATAAREASKALSGAPTARQPEMARAADQYLAGAVAIVERRLDSARLARQAAAARDALSAHLAAPGRRSAGWIHQAVELKKSAEYVHNDLQRALEALAVNLDSLEAPEEVLARYMDAGRLTPKTLRQGAAERARAEAKAAAEALERVGRLP